MGIAEPKPFNASSGWLHRFKRRNNITNINIGGEEASADRVAARDFPPFLREFQKERITVLFTTNASGTCKPKLSVIHTARKPHAYRNVDMTKINVHWLTARKAWMFSALSLSWFDDCFIPDVKKFCEQKNVPFKILLLLDNAPGHSPLLMDRHPNVKVVFLPPNTMSLIQPMDQELICNVKAAYSAKKFKLLNDCTNTKDELRKLGDTDRQGTRATIRHAWRHVLHGIPEKLKLFHSNDHDDDRYEVFHTRLVQAMEPYIKVYQDNINTSRQKSITEFFARNPPQPARASESDFEGFVREALTTITDSDGDAPSNGDSPEGQ
ncbi:Jerky protein-like 31 [Homarus americanus]|uniref:Jerky protein-like 31 n=1 Tax=Homarus americanus TaxID=6706 RepID=A0A8J5MWI9_HOMAM|nr:Jerky protein-like 31 [Homarus americanus]